MTQDFPDRGQSDAAFKKAQRAQDAEQANKEHAATVLAVVEKTARLRALRLAKEAADLPPVVAKKRRVAST